MSVFWVRAVVRGCATLSVLVSLGSLSADVLVSESFDYDAGPLSEQDGGEGWLDPWLVSEELLDTDFLLDVVEPEQPLVYSLPSGGFINGGDRALEFRNADAETVLGNDNAALTRGFEDILADDELYFSFLYRYGGDGTDTGGTINDNDFIVWWFNSNSGPQAGLKGNFGNGSQPDDFVGRVSGAFAAPQQAYAPGIDISAEAGTLNDTWLVVGKMSRAGNSDVEDDYDQLELWINPGADDLDSPNAVAMAAAGDSLIVDVESIGLRIFNAEPGDAMMWDELRIGETWDDVISPLGDQNVVVETCTQPSGGILGDLDQDGSVGFSDFLALSANFGAENVAYSEGDVDCDGAVGFADFLALSANFGTSATAAAVPEPSSLALSSFVLLMAGCLRRRRAV